MNSFRAVQRALDSEIERQSAVLDAGGTLVQETRGWVETQGRTVSQRSKEQAHDYRYFPEPDLPPLRLDAARSSSASGPPSRSFPRLAPLRFQSQYGLTAYDAAVLTDTRESADCFEALVDAGVPAKLAANWQSGDVAALANEHKIPLQRSGLGVDGLASLLRLVDSGAVNGPTAKDLLVELYVPGGDPEAVVRERGLGQVSDTEALGGARRRGDRGNTPAPRPTFVPASSRRSAS